jgi:hypothetical protein
MSVVPRRRFLTTLSAAGAAGLVRAPPSLAAEGALETTTVRFAKIPAICLAPQYVSDELLRAEGITRFACMNSASSNRRRRRSSPRTPIGVSSTN